MNTHVRDNLLETAVAKVTTAGDIVYATGATALSRLAGGSANWTRFLRLNAAGTALEWVVVPNIIGPEQWGQVPALEGWVDFRYLSATILTELANHTDWSHTGAASVNGFSNAQAGDTNSQADAETAGLRFATAGNTFASPPIALGWSQLQTLTKINGGVAPTTLTLSMIARTDITTAIADDCIGFGNQSGVTMVGAGHLAIINGATNFEYRLNGAAGVSLAVAKDVLPHLYEFVITISAVTCDIKIDGTTRATGVALTEDTWPRGFRAHMVTGTTDWVLLALGFKYT